MAAKNFRRQALEDLGVTDKETIDKIMDLYHEIVDPIKDERDKYKAEAETVPELKRAKADLESRLKTVETERDDFKTKHESEKAEHDKLKADIAGKEVSAKKEKILKDWLKETKYSNEGSMVILDSKEDYANRIQLDENGKATNLKDVTDAIQKKHYMYTPKEEVKSDAPDNPPTNVGGKTTMKKSEIMKIKDSAERQKAIKESIESGSNDFRI